MAGRAQWPAVRRRLSALYGDDQLFESADGFGVRTGSGRFVVLDKVAVERSYAPLPPELSLEERPCCVAIHVAVPDLTTVASFLASAGVEFTQAGPQLRLRRAAPYGNVFLAFDASRRLV